MFSKFFINRPIFATVLALLIVVAGLVTLNILPVAQFPEITPPTVQVSAVYPGANVALNPPDGNEDASGSPLISSFPENSSKTLPSSVGLMNVVDEDIGDGVS